MVVSNGEWLYSYGEWFYFGSIISFILMYTGGREADRLRKKANFEHLNDAEWQVKMRKSAENYDSLWFVGTLFFVLCMIGLFIYLFF